MRRGTLRAVVGISEVALDSVGAVTPVSPRNPEVVGATGFDQRSGSQREREAATILHIPAQTMARCRQARKLRVDESDRLYRIAHVAGQAVSVFGSEDKAATWLQRPNRALNGELPIRLLDTDIGALQVEDILGKIEHGNVS
jgi:putative toxin-antitoxin system antitoxin component (TIGR02293 family)